MGFGDHDHPAKWHVGLALCKDVPFMNGLTSITFLSLFGSVELECSGVNFEQPPTATSLEWSRHRCNK